MLPIPFKNLSQRDMNPVNKSPSGDRYFYLIFDFASTETLARNILLVLFYLLFLSVDFFFVGDSIYMSHKEIKVERCLDVSRG